MGVVKGTHPQHLPLNIGYFFYKLKGGDLPLEQFQRSINLYLQSSGLSNSELVGQVTEYLNTYFKVNIVWSGEVGKSNVLKFY